MHQTKRNWLTILYTVIKAQSLSCNHNYHYMPSCFACILSYRVIFFFSFLVGGGAGTGVGGGTHPNRVARVWCMYLSPRIQGRCLRSQCIRCLIYTCPPFTCGSPGCSKGQETAPLFHRSLIHLRKKETVLKTFSWWKS